MCEAGGAAAAAGLGLRVRLRPYVFWHFLWKVCRGNLAEIRGGPRLEGPVGRWACAG